LNLLHIFKSSLRRNLIVGVMLLMLIGFACSDSSVETVFSTPTPPPTSTIAVPTIPASPFPTATVMAPTESTPTPVTSPRANPHQTPVQPASRQPSETDTRSNADADFAERQQPAFHFESQIQRQAGLLRREDFVALVGCIIIYDIIRPWHHG